MIHMEFYTFFFILILTLWQKIRSQKPEEQRDERVNRKWSEEPIMRQSEALRKLSYETSSLLSIKDSSITMWLNINKNTNLVVLWTVQNFFAPLACLEYTCLLASGFFFNCASPNVASNNLIRKLVLSDHFTPAHQGTTSREVEETAVSVWTTGRTARGWKCLCESRRRAERRIDKESASTAFGNGRKENDESWNVANFWIRQKRSDEKVCLVKAWIETYTKTGEAFHRLEIKAFSYAFKRLER